MSGGFNGYDMAATEPQRLPLLQKAIHELQADVLGLIDTFRWHQLYSTDQLCRMFGYDYAFCINLDDKRLHNDQGEHIGLTLLSAVPLAEVKIVRLATRNAILARLADGDITIVLAYLDDLSETVRLTQVTAILSAIDVASPTIVMGDLNSFSQDVAARTQSVLDTFYAANPPLRSTLGPVTTDMQRGEVVAALRASGLRDADSLGIPTAPTRLFPAQSERQFLRIDYCFHSPSIEVTHFAVPTDAIFQEASDHLPIVFDIVRR